MYQDYTDLVEPFGIDELVDVSAPSTCSGDPEPWPKAAAAGSPGGSV